jgi:hypothetical protein
VDPAIGAWLRGAAPGTPLVIFECVGVPGGNQSFSR